MKRAMDIERFMDQSRKENSLTRGESHVQFADRANTPIKAANQNPIGKSTADL